MKIRGVNRYNTDSPLLNSLHVKLHLAYICKMFIMGMLLRIIFLPSVFRNECNPNHHSNILKNIFFGCSGSVTCYDFGKRGSQALCSARLRRWHRGETKVPATHQAPCLQSLISTASGVPMAGTPRAGPRQRQQHPFQGSKPDGRSKSQSMEHSMGHGGRRGASHPTVEAQRRRSKVLQSPKPKSQPASFCHRRDCRLMIA